MTTFRVSPSDLESLASQISGLLGELEQAAANVSAGSAGAAQNARLENAIDGFLHSWSHSIESLKARLSEVADRLNTAGAAYGTVDSDVAHHFDIV